MFPDGHILIYGTFLLSRDGAHICFIKCPTQIVSNIQHKFRANLHPLPRKRPLHKVFLHDDTTCVQQTTKRDGYRQQRPTKLNTTFTCATSEQKRPYSAFLLLDTHLRPLIARNHLGTTPDPELEQTQTTSSIDFEVYCFEVY